MCCLKTHPLTTTQDETEDEKILAELSHHNCSHSIHPHPPGKAATIVLIMLPVLIIVLPITGTLAHVIMSLDHTGARVVGGLAGGGGGGGEGWGDRGGGMGGGQGTVLVLILTTTDSVHLQPTIVDGRDVSQESVNGRVCGGLVQKLRLIPVFDV